jgi:MFS transporter, Spinster family, sphingosine-1-phosphate transporter
MMGCGGMIGVSLGGWQASRLAGRGLRAMLWMPIAGLTAAVPLFILALLATDIRVTLALLVVPMMLGNFWTAPSIALTQNLSPVAARATASAICIVASNLIGVALGPIAAGLVSDAFARALGDPAQGLRWALIAAALTMFWGIAHWVLAARALGARRAPDPVAIAEVLPLRHLAGEVP